MAIHLVLVGVEKLSPGLNGAVLIYSNCVAAISKVEHLPPLHFPTRCQHSDILKNILIHCQAMTFNIEFKNIKAHQDDQMEFKNLSRPSQLNCAVHAKAKATLLREAMINARSRQSHPLKPVVCYDGTGKITADTGALLRFWAHRRLAREAMALGRVLSPEQFDLVAWESVSAGLRDTPRMFQIWACKQVWNIAGTNFPRSKWDKTIDSRCPSCRRCKESCAHVLLCPEVG